MVRLSAIRTSEIYVSPNNYSVYANSILNPPPKKNCLLHGGGILSDRKILLYKYFSMLSKLQNLCKICKLQNSLFVEKVIYLSRKHCEILYMINNINQKYYQKCYINRSCATHICKSLLCMITTEIIFDT